MRQSAPVVPQWTTSSILYDTGWQQISFQFTASAAFDWITFGNFIDDANTNAQVFDAAASIVAYYYLDSISVEEATQGNPGFFSSDTAVCEKFCIDFTDFQRIPQRSGSGILKEGALLLQPIRIL